MSEGEVSTEFKLEVESFLVGVEMELPSVVASVRLPFPGDGGRLTRWMGREWDPDPGTLPELSRRNEY